MSQCDKYLEDISCYLDGELCREDAAALEAHLDTCHECRLFFEAFSAVSQGVSEDLYVKAPADLADGVMYKLDLQENPRCHKKGRAKVYLGRFTALAACAALIIFAATKLPSISGNNDISFSEETGTYTDDMEDEASDDSMDDGHIHSDDDAGEPPLPTYDTVLEPENRGDLANPTQDEDYNSVGEDTAESEEFSAFGVLEDEDHWPQADSDTSRRASSDLLSIQSASISTYSGAHLADITDYDELSVLSGLLAWVQDEALVVYASGAPDYVLVLTGADGAPFSTEVWVSGNELLCGVGDDDGSVYLAQGSAQEFLALLSSEE